MDTYVNDTICAIATAPGGAVAIVRVSGPGARALCRPFWKSEGGKTVDRLTPRALVLGCFMDGGSIIDPSCLAVLMPGPRSYTGEDVVEFHCHGGAVCARMLLRSLLRGGIRHAEPGEFTKRAFLNGRMDLTQAEAVADMVSAGSEAALRMAGMQLQGCIGRRVDSISDELDAIRAEVESRLDFPEEDLEWLGVDEMLSSLERLCGALEDLARSRDYGELMRGGASLVIAGAPNVGKSSLLNRMLGRDRVIVSDVPGTTRDTVEACAQLGGIPFRLVDTAGIRGGGDQVEKEGMERSMKAAASADVLLWVMDGTAAPGEHPFPGWPVHGHLISVVNKADAMDGGMKAAYLADAPSSVFVSAMTGEGMDGLYSAMEEAVLQGAHSWEEMGVSARHASLLEQASSSVRQAMHFAGTEEWELVAVHLRDAVAAIGRITGRTVLPDVLDDIFSRFCIGK